MIRLRLTVGLSALTRIIVVRIHRAEQTRGSQVVKAEVCKTSYREFESHPRDKTGGSSTGGVRSLELRGCKFESCPPD